MKPDEASELLNKNFRRKRVGHRVAKTVLNQLLTAVLSAGKEKIIALVGPTGVGKSAVINRLRERLIEHFRQQMEQDPAFIPFLYLSTKTTYGNNFSWKDAFARMLVAANEPLVGKKVAFQGLHLDGSPLASISGLSTDPMGRAFESFVRHRRVKIIFFDEGSAMVDATVNKNVVQQFKILKSLAVELGIVIVLIGAYDLLGIDESDGQLTRRARVIHMPRYQVGHRTMASSEDTDLDDVAFGDAAIELGKAAPVSIKDDVLSDFHYLLNMSAGSFGNFRDWLDTACVEALVHHDSVLTREVFEACALPNRTVKKFIEEARVGEEMLTDIDEGALAKSIGVESLRSPPELDADAGDDVPKKRKGHKGRVGQRNPSRDAVGEPHA